MATRFAASPSILNFMANSPNYGKLASDGAMENAKTEAQNLLGNAKVHRAGITGRSRMVIAKNEGKVTRARGRAAGHGALMDGIQSGIQGLSSGIGSKFGGSGGGGGGGDGDTFSGYGIDLDKYTDLWSTSPDMSGFPTSFSGTEFSGFPTSTGIA
jgi:hypothetical protein